MFHAIKLEKIDFKSNPPLEPVMTVDYTTREDGSPINLFIKKDRSNKGLSGAHYDPSTMSLRARLARGIELQKVSYGIIENDPNVITRKARKLISDIDASAAARQVSADIPETTVEPSNSNNYVSAIQ